MNKDSRRVKRIAVYFERFRPSVHENKEVGQIIFGFLDLGIDVDLITYYKKELDSYKPPFGIKIISEKINEKLWKDYDLVIALTWLSPKYNTFIKTVKDLSIPIVVKGDTDGRITFPVPPRIWYMIKVKPHKLAIKNVLRIAKGIIVHRKRLTKLIEQIDLADAIVLESPSALSNLAYILTESGNFELIKKLSFIPSPVAEDVMNYPLKEKKRLIITVANWNAYEQKNSFVMIDVIEQFTKIRKDYEVKIVGQNDLIHSKLQESEERVKVLGYEPHKKLIELMAEAQISFSPSIFESFNLSIAESLCLGCSFTGTPIESFYFFSHGGEFGTLASDFSKNALLSSLLIETIKWDMGKYNPEKIANFWRNKLERSKIAKAFLETIF
ncbi:MAG: glycosyltransferase [Candidatus Aenigmatarchaeota archaeon]